ncbi:MAG: peptide chain release factor N(5)-glutamine methyltransferase [Burkholderiaceae bacterium]
MSPCFDVATALAQARCASVDRLDAQLLLGHVLERPRTWLLAHGEAPLDATTWQRYVDLLRRRADGEPVAYLIGSKEFHGLTLRLDRRVLVPRPDTEVLVDWALELLGTHCAGNPAPRVADLGTGSGAIALAVKCGHPSARVVATDASRDALAVASANARRLGMSIETRSGSWWDALPDARFDLALSNPPYIAAGDPHLTALAHEPIEALTPGGDGLAALHAIVAGARDHLHVGAWLLLEHGHDQAAAVQGLLHRYGFGAAVTRPDLAGQPRCTGAPWQAADPLRR